MELVKKVDVRLARFVPGTGAADSRRKRTFRRAEGTSCRFNGGLGRLTEGRESLGRCVEMMFKLFENEYNIEENQSRCIHNHSNPKSVKKRSGEVLECRGEGGGCAPACRPARPPTVAALRSDVIHHQARRREHA